MTTTAVRAPGSATSTAGRRAGTLDDWGKLVLCVTVGGLLLFHGVDKIVNGIAGVRHDLVTRGVPGFVGYGVYLAEVVAPLLVMVGVWTRPAALICSGAVLSRGSSAFVGVRRRVPVIWRWFWLHRPAAQQRPYRATPATCVAGVR